MITDARLALLRARSDMALPDRCSIRRPSTVPDGRGGRTVTYTTVATNIPCRLAAASTRVRTEMVAAGRVAFMGPWTITLPAETDIDERDQLVIGNRTFEATLVSAISYEVVRRVEATEVV